jgi:hypothetical protein
MSLGSIRGFLYWLARLLGDINAVQRGRVGRRMGRRLFGKATGRLMRKLFK